MFEQYLEDFAVGQTFSSGCLAHRRRANQRILGSGQFL